MTLKQLRYFVTVTEELNFRRAVVRLDVSQSAISRQIKYLEDELGVVLLHRDSLKTTKLMPAGESFLVNAQYILKQTAKLLERMKHFRQSEVKGHFSRNSK